MPADNGIRNQGTAFEFLAGVLSLLARVGGLVLLVVGLWVGVRVIGEAWDLYQEPQRIEQFAQAVEHGSNIDKTLLPNNRGPAISEEQPRYAATGDDFRPSYFLTWLIVFALLLILGRLAAWAVVSGGQLAIAGALRNSGGGKKTKIEER